MEIYQDIAGLPVAAKGALIAIGNFDGVHRGHRALLDEGRRLANAKGLKFGVLTFEPHPRKLFRPDDPPFRITPPSIKYRLIEKAKADFIVSLPFDWDFASQSAEDFVQNILVWGLKAAHVITGVDFRFGQLRKGSLQTIEQAGIPVTAFAAIGDQDGEKFSSTAIRGALRLGDIEEANALLGWEWEIEGEIFRGDRRGHELGYPTANILLGDILHPAYGIYATLVQIEGEEQWRPAATNIGIRPMFEVKTGQVEAHILDFEDRDIYGKTLRVLPVARLRGEAKFASLEALIVQIETDCAQTRSLLADR
ncbi:MAG: riboflavin biosynthesis protein RibF [Micavibrio aeruginosavorus]|uniref:Riboflavin biosynthesis protein n=1 Tax=Micavibrio aeruginosavorus TaxID=349221 RepID=A0A2W5MYQ6_9BACT|nr:MAG: riboflavin biosynthesis protein RibF [Micavibrio aeruginosavorus]